MAEIEKMYKNAGIGKRCISKDSCHKDFVVCLRCCAYSHPPFTAEKQLELIKWLSKRCFYIEISEMRNKSYGIAFKYQPADEYKNEQSECCVNKNFAEALAESTNYIWQDLTKSEQEQIRSILNG